MTDTEDTKIALIPCTVFSGSWTILEVGSCRHPALAQIKFAARSAEERPRKGAPIVQVKYGHAEMLVCRLHSWPRPMARLRRTLTSKKLVKGAHLLRRLPGDPMISVNVECKEKCPVENCYSRISLPVRTVQFFYCCLRPRSCLLYRVMLFVAVCGVPSFWKLLTDLGITGTWPRLGAKWSPALAMAPNAMPACIRVPAHKCRGVDGNVGRTGPFQHFLKPREPLPTMVTVGRRA
jgi:hypothetical protein